MSRSSVELIVDCRIRLGESPVWDPRRGELVWVNIHDGEIWRHNPAKGRTRTHQLPDRIGALGIRRDHGYVLALASGFALFDPDLERLDWLEQVEKDLPRTRLNDGRVDRDGRFVCGGMDEGEPQQPLSAVYRLDPGGTVERLLNGIHCANSTCFSLDGKTMYFTDMPTGRIDAYSYDAERPHSPHTFVDISSDPGLADGSTIDDEGFLWNAQWGGGRVVRYTRDGEVDRVIRLPVTNPTSVCFGGDDYGTLYVTTARFGLSETTLAAEVSAGGVFALRPGVHGVPEPQFAS